MLDAALYERLSRLQLAQAHKSSLNMSGNRKSVHKGISAEFSDFREYMPGDDLRRIDWNVYARLDRLYIREYMEEKESVVSVLVDTSASMDYGEASKAELARDLAAVVGFLALNNMDRLILYDMKRMGQALPVSGGRKGFYKVQRWLRALDFSGEVDMLGAARQMQLRGPGVTVIISDFLHEEVLGENRSYEKLIRWLDYCKQRAVILQTLAPEELSVTLSGAYNLIDSERESRLKVTVDAKAAAAYERQLAALMQRLRRGCHAYVCCDAGKDRRQLLFDDLRVIYDI